MESNSSIPNINDASFLKFDYSQIEKKVDNQEKIKNLFSKNNLTFVADKKIKKSKVIDNKKSLLNQYQAQISDKISHITKRRYPPKLLCENSSDKYKIREPSYTEISEAAQENRLEEFLPYLDEKIPPELKKDCVSWMMRAGNFPVLKILLEDKKYPKIWGYQDSENLFDIPIQDGSPENALVILQYLKQQGLTPNQNSSVYTSYAVDGKNEKLINVALGFYREMGWKLTPDILIQLIHHKHADVWDQLKNEFTLSNSQFFDDFIKNFPVDELQFDTIKLKISQEALKILKENSTLTVVGWREVIKKNNIWFLQDLLKHPHLQKSLSSLSEENKALIWKEAYHTENIYILKELGRHLSALNLREAVKTGKTDILSWALQNAEIEDILWEKTEIESLLFDCKNLDLYYVWFSFTLKTYDKNQILEKIYQLIFEPFDESPKLKEILEDLFLYTSDFVIQDLIDYVKNSRNPEIAQNLENYYQDILNWGGLVTRTQNFYSRESLITSYKIENYEENQKKLAHSALESARSLLPFFSNQSSYMDCLALLTNWRKGIAQKNQDSTLEKSAIEWRMDEKQIAHTPIEKTKLTCRYANAVPTVITTYHYLKSHSQFGHIEGPHSDEFAEPLLRLYETSYQLTYSYANQSFPLTKVALYCREYSFTHSGWRWLHTDNQTLKALLSRMDELHQQILLFKGEDQNQLHDLIAEAYWLGCHLMPTVRGNAQNMLIMLTAWYHYHGFSSPVTNIIYEQLDCIAISTPLNLFKEKFQLYFSRVPTKII